MRIVLLLSLFVASTHLAAQTPPQPAPKPPAGTPAPTQPGAPATPPTAKPAPRPAARTALVITATTPEGETLPGVRVDVLGAADRSGETDASGTLRFANMRPGTYRVRFSGPSVITFEREAVVRAGQTADLDVTLNRAPEPPPAAPPEPAAPAAAAPAPVGPTGQPVTIDIPELADRNLIKREPRRESRVACSGNARTTLVQLNEPQPERIYETAEAIYYVVAGEGAITISGRETRLAAGMYAMVPRGTSFGLTRRGRFPLVLLSVLSGEPCEATP